MTTYEPRFWSRFHGRQQSDVAALGHRFDRIVQQIEKNLLQLLRIGQDRGQAGRPIVQKTQAILPDLVTHQGQSSCR